MREPTSAELRWGHRSVMFMAGVEAHLLVQQAGADADLDRRFLPPADDFVIRSAIIIIREPCCGTNE